ncbi:hypothetical protein LH412_13535 [Yersinia intermedia]|uniref:winged helix-turn-helix domain-containing protein n=1 Tax=Yersinia intermedia TaxID=631 RepID=UPI001CFC594B|nr:hypothetical protein [Yersinia intermedia]MCB5323034.1 hypothetical protein [Yersinia intermedia]
MNRLTIINKIVAYDYNNAIIYNINKPEKSVSLYAPTNECLYILLDQYPNVIPQNYFFEQAWEKQGLTTTNNNFYPHISMIRRAFEVVGLNGDIILTLPRRGLSLSKDLEITHEEKKRQDKKEEIVIDETSNNATINNSMLRASLWVVVSILIIILFSILLYNKNSPYEKSIENYYHVEDIELCHLFSLSEGYDISNVKEIIRNEKINCNKAKNLYYTTYPIIKRESLIYCDVLNSTPKNCISYLMIK